MIGSGWVKTTVKAGWTHLSTQLEDTSTCIAASPAMIPGWRVARVLLDDQDEVIMNLNPTHIWFMIRYVLANLAIMNLHNCQQLILFLPVLVLLVYGEGQSYDPIFVDGHETLLTNHIILARKPWNTSSWYENFKNTRLMFEGKTKSCTTAMAKQSGCSSCRYCYWCW